MHFGLFDKFRNFLRNVTKLVGFIITAFIIRYLPRVRVVLQDKFYVLATLFRAKIKRLLECINKRFFFPERNEISKNLFIVLIFYLYHPSLFRG